MVCSSCGKLVSDHPTWTAESIEMSRCATYRDPVSVIVSDGTRRTVLAPLSPTLIGRYWSHDPRPWRNAPASYLSPFTRRALARELPGKVVA